MAIVGLQHVLQLPVITVSGVRLGKVADVEMDVDTHQVQTYLVRPGRLTRPLARQVLRIHRDQVVAITAERMVVDDAVGRTATDSRVRTVARAPSPLSARIG